MRMHISFAGEIMILVSHMSEIRPEKDYPELSAICPNEMHYGTQSVVGNASVSIQRNRYNDISRLHTDRDVCKESTDTSKEATQGCSATLNPVKRFRNPLRWQQMKTDTESRARGTPQNLFVGGCQYGVCQVPKKPLTSHLKMIFLQKYLYINI